MNILRNIDHYRMDAALTRRQLADKAGVSIRRMNSNNKLTVIDVIHIAKILGIDPSRLYDEPKYKWISKILPSAKGRMQIRIMTMSNKPDYKARGLHIVKDNGFCTITAFEQFGVILMVDGMEIVAMLSSEVVQS